MKRALDQVGQYLAKGVRTPLLEQARKSPKPTAPLFNELEIDRVADMAVSDDVPRCWNRGTFEGERFKVWRARPLRQLQCVLDFFASSLT